MPIHCHLIRTSGESTFVGTNVVVGHFSYLRGVDYELVKVFYFPYTFSRTITKPTQPLY